MLAKLWTNTLPHLTNHPNSFSEIALDGQPKSNRRASHCNILLLVFLTHRGLWEICCQDCIVARCFGKNLFLLFQGNFLLFQDSLTYINIFFFVNTGTWLAVLVPPFLQVLLIPNKTQGLSLLHHFVSFALFLLSVWWCTRYFSKYGFLTLQ